MLSSEDDGDVKEEAKLGSKVEDVETKVGGAADGGGGGEEEEEAQPHGRDSEAGRAEGAAGLEGQVQEQRGDRGRGAIVEGKNILVIFFKIFFMSCVFLW